METRLLLSSAALLLPQTGPTAPGNLQAAQNVIWVDQAAAAQATLINATPLTLTAALSNASGGEVIALAPGSYGDLSFSGKHFSSEVVVRSANPNQHAQFNTISLTNVRNLTFSNVTVDFSPEASTATWTPAVTITNSRDIDLADVMVLGGPAIADGSGSVKGLPTGQGINVRDSQHVSIRATEISEFFRGIVLTSVDNVEVVDSHIHDLRTSPLVGADVAHLRVQGNHFHSSHPLNFGGSGDHGDYIHLWTRSHEYQSDPNSDIVIIDNIFQQGTGHSLLGVFLEDAYALGNVNVTITGNIFHIGDGQAIRLENTRQFNVSGNSLIQSSGTSKEIPGILVGSDSRDGKIEKNVAGAIDFTVSAANRATIAVANNIFVQGYSASQENYVGDLFVDALNPMASGLGLKALPGTAIDQLRAGSHLTHLSPSEPVWLFTRKTGSGIQEVTLDATPYGGVPTANVSVSWQFGDGSSGSGQSVSHRYAKGGRYQVKMTVTKGSSRWDVTRTLFVQDSVVFDLPFHGRSITDRSNTPLDVWWEGTPAFAPGKEGDGASFNGAKSYLVVEADYSLIAMEELSVGLDFKLDKLQPTGRARLVWNHEHYGMEILSGRLTMFVKTEFSGTKEIVVNAALKPGQWYHAELRYSSATGTMEAWLDGQRVGSRNGLTGRISADGVRATYIGGTPWENAIDGTIDNVRVSLESSPPAKGDSIFGRMADGRIWIAVSNGTTFTNRLWATLPAGTDWQNIQVGDFNGDGRDDFAARDDEGDWWVWTAGADRFTAAKWGGRWNPSIRWTNVMAGDFNGDGRADIAGRAQSGAWYVAESTGSGFAVTFLGGWSADVTWADVNRGDFNGDGIDDVVGRGPTGTWVILQSTGNGSNHVNLVAGTWSTGVTWSDVLVGDFDNDGNDDVVGRSSRGSWYVAFSDGNGFTNAFAKSWSTNVSWHDVTVGDFNGDGRADVAGRSSNGTWYILQPTGGTGANTRFTTRYAGMWSTNVTWLDVVTGDFDDDGKTDIAGRASSGSWYVARATGSGFTNELWGSWSAAVAWSDTDRISVG